MALGSEPEHPPLSSVDEKLTLEKKDSESENSLLELYPEYGSTSRLDTLRGTEYAYLDEQNHVYLDYTGAGLAAHAQHHAHSSRLVSTLYGNPHSTSPTSSKSTFLIEEARARVLSFFNASEKEYAVIFTPNATGAARLVGEAYPFSRRKKLLLTADNHNSINGLREFARRNGTRTAYIPATAPELRTDTAVVQAALRRRGFRDAVFMSGLGGRNGKRGLFAYPAQSNFSGVRHPLAWVAMAQKEGYDVLLDVAAYVPTAKLDLAVVRPEFVVVSWYKVFGYPTGVGCLIAKRSALARLKRPWFAGGTIRYVAVQRRLHAMTGDESAFEDGTVNFLAIPDVAFGLEWVRGIGLDVIATRVRCLTDWFLERLVTMKHSDGSPMVRVYGPISMEARGGIVTFNFLDATGRVVDERIVAEESSKAGISLRTGCFCNPGIAECALGLGKKQIMTLQHKKNAPLDNIISGLGLPSAGCIRVSLGIASNSGDVDAFFAFAMKTYRDRWTSSVGLEPRDRC